MFLTNPNPREEFFGASVSELWFVRLYDTHHDIRASAPGSGEELAKEHGDNDLYDVKTSFLLFQFPGFPLIGHDGTGPVRIVERFEEALAVRLSFFLLLFCNYTSIRI